MTDATENKSLLKALQPRIAFEFSQYQETHPGLSEEEKSGIRLLIAQKLLSERVRNIELQYQRSLNKATSTTLSIN